MEDPKYVSLGISIGYREELQGPQKWTAQYSKAVNQYNAEFPRPERVYTLPMISCVGWIVPVTERREL